MQDTNDGNSVVGDTKVNHMPFNMSAPIARSDVITGRCRFGRLRQPGKGGGQEIDITIGLCYAPLLEAMRSDGFKIAFGRRAEAVFSHERPAFFA